MRAHGILVRWNDERGFGFIAPAGSAAELFVHRHTLRYRMRKVEELTGRDLSSSFDRMEFWLALRARELQAVDLDG